MCAKFILGISVLLIFRKDSFWTAGTAFKASIQDYPYVVSLEYEGLYKCGGALIHLKHAVTTAHCFDDTGIDPQTWLVRAGTEKKSTGGVLETVYRIILHDHFQSRVLAHFNDIALVTLIKRLPSRSNIKPVPIISTGEEPVDGERGYFTGWDKEIGDLKVFELNILKRTECKKLVSSRDLINSEMICAIPDVDIDTQGDVICEEDDGGPLVISHHLVGLASWSNTVLNEKCSSPSVFTNMEKFRSWVKKHSGV